MIATEMVMIGAGVVAISGTRRAVASSIEMQETNRDSMGRGEPCLFDLMSNGKDRINGETGHHRYQSYCNKFSEALIQENRGSHSVADEP